MSETRHARTQRATGHPSDHEPGPDRADSGQTMGEIHPAFSSLIREAEVQARVVDWDYVGDDDSSPIRFRYRKKGPAGLGQRELGAMPRGQDRESTRKHGDHDEPQDLESGLAARGGNPLAATAAAIAVVAGKS